MNRPPPLPPSSPPRRRAGPRAGAGFTLLEMMIALALGSVVFAAALASIVFLQKSYVGTEQYATNLADQTRLMDYLCLDLRRATDATFTTSGTQTTGLTLTLPDYYGNGNVTTNSVPTAPHLNLSSPYYGATPNSSFRVVYSLQASFQDPKLGVVTNAITRKEGGGPDSAVAAGMVGFPQIKLYNSGGVEATTFKQALQARLTIIFRPRFQTPALSDTNAITLHGVAFLRNNDLR